MHSTLQSPRNTPLHLYPPPASHPPIIIALRFPYSLHLFRSDHCFEYPKYAQRSHLDGRQEPKRASAEHRSEANDDNSRRCVEDDVGRAIPVRCDGESDGRESSVVASSHISLRRKKQFHLIDVLLRDDSLKPTSQRRVRTDTNIRCTHVHRHEGVKHALLASLEVSQHISCAQARIVGVPAGLKKMNGTAKSVRLHHI